MEKKDLYYTSAADAARAAGVSDDQIINRVKSGQIKGAYQNEDGWYRVPVAGLIEAGYNVTGEGAEIIGPLSAGSTARRYPNPDQEDELSLVWEGEDIPPVVYHKDTKTFEANSAFPKVDTPGKAKRLGATFQAAAEWVETNNLD